LASVSISPPQCWRAGLFFASCGVRELALAFIPRGSPRRVTRPGQPGPASNRRGKRNKVAASRRTPNFASATTLRPPPCAATHVIRKFSIPSMAQREAKFYWPSVRFLLARQYCGGSARFWSPPASWRERVNWLFEIRAKCENGKLKMGRQRQRLPPFATGPKDWAPRLPDTARCLPSCRIDVLIMHGQYGLDFSS
jgi:hypothetical protein